MTRKPSRRTFIKTTAVASAGFWVAGGVKAADSTAASEEIRFACVGVGGKGSSDSADAARNGVVVAACDIDENNLKRGVAKLQAEGKPAIKPYHDYRKMIEEVAKDVDAVTVSTPDHNHAPASIRALREGLAVFCQKPLTHTIHEARVMGELAAEKNVATQMGNQGTANSSLREAAAIVKSGGLGEIKEVHVWTNRPVWPQGLDRPKETPPVPDNVHWDEWIGPAQMRPYNAAYHPFKWRGWWEFGTGALGDMACHTLNMPFMGADLRYPTSVQATTSGHNRETYPGRSEIVFQFPATEYRPAIPFTWYDGGNRPDGELLRGKKNKSGCLVIGSKGTLFSGDDYCGSFEVWDIDKAKVDYPKSPGHFEEFANAIRTDNKEPAMSNFPNYASPLTETILLGNLAVWLATEDGVAGKKVEWDAKNLKATNAPEVAHIVNKEYREGWGI